MFRLTEHIERLLRLGQDHDDGDPVHGRRAGRRRRRRRWPSTGCPAATSGRSPTTATARWASTRCRARSTWPSPAGRGAPTSATTRSRKGVRMKISSWTRHDHNTMPPASKTTGNYVNSSLAKVEALKAGYDEAIMLDPQGFVSECTGENIFVVRNGMLITPAAVGRRARGHHAELGDDHRPRPRLRGPRRRPGPQRPLHRRGDVRVRHRRRGRRRSTRSTTASCRAPAR